MDGPARWQRQRHGPHVRVAQRDRAGVVRRWHRLPLPPLRVHEREPTVGGGSRLPSQGPPGCTAAGPADAASFPTTRQTDIKRPRSAIRRLRSDLLHALDGIKGWREMDPEALAEAVAEAVYEERPDREPAEPLTPEQIIHRITFLVDSGRLAEMHQSVERTAAALVESTDARNRLTGEVTTLQQQLATAEAEVERLHEERRVLRDLLSESEAS